MNTISEKSLLDTIHENGDWLSFAQNCALNGLCTGELQKSFHLYWIVKGHHIRFQVNDDTKLLSILRILLPPYTGKGLWLYRGENLARFEVKKIGFCWTTKEDTAVMFARGLNAYKAGGVLLKAWAPSAAIISGVHEHSEYLGEDELTVDGLLVEKLQVLQTFPPFPSY